MRITGGSLRGRSVEVPPGIIRPAMDRMRESFFAILGPLDGLSFLDLFSGSGCIGLEAYSRGAWPVRCVEKDSGKRPIIMKNLSLADRRIDLSVMPAERFVMSWKEGFDMIFLDPPFDYPFKEELLARLLNSKILAPGSKVYLHYPDENEIPDTIKQEVPGQDGAERSLTLFDERKYGRSIVKFYTADI